MRKIKAKVSQKWLKNISLFFNQRFATTLTELLQNSRRAGATRVDITTKTQNTLTELVIEDNGRGIADPAILLYLSESDWDAEVTSAETPAGFGFFSLSHLPGGVVVRSHDWEVVLTPEAFTATYEPVVRDDLEYFFGTRLQFQVKDEWPLNEIIKEVARYYPVPVFLNGTELLQKPDYLSEYTWIKDIGGARIGLTQKPRYASSSPALIGSANFYGLGL